MPDMALRAAGLRKRYRIGQGARYKSIRDVVATSFRLRRRRSSNEDAWLWALDGVTFEVRSGEAVGIIGRNGAGKSTLLKILSRITEPTEGSATIHGRVGSLLEVGTGFHPELTARENILLNGVILGMSRREVMRKFDEIIDFAEVHRFVDTQVKHFSSGMYTRLAFAVAAHLEPEILLVDEVLAVGDASFQRKCLNKMESVSQGGRTVLFVSHNMQSVTRLCSRTVLLDEGKVVADGPSAEVVTRYLKSHAGSTAIREWPDANSAPGNDVVRLRAVRVRSQDHVREAVDIRHPVTVEAEYDVLQPGRVLVPNFHFYNEEGLCLFITNDCVSEWRRRPRPVGAYVSEVQVPGNFFAEGTVFINVAVSTMDPVEVHLFERDAVAFQVVDSMDGDSVRGDYGGPLPGAVRPMLPWQTRLVREHRANATVV
jgi:lipopolysaccharide transport system ATP-binding protein